MGGEFDIGGVLTALGGDSVENLELFDWIYLVLLLLHDAPLPMRLAFPLLFRPRLARKKRLKLLQKCVRVIVLLPCHGILLS